MPEVPTDALRLRLLVLRCQAGDDGAFARLMEQFGPRTLAHLRGLTGEVADDIQQELWLSVYRGLHRLADAGAFRTWLFQATRHRAIDHLRRLRRERELFADPGPMVVAEVTADETPLDLSQEVEDALGRLSPRQREVIMLRFQDGLSYEEIALVSGSPIGTVRSRIHLARQRLREMLGEG